MPCAIGATHTILESILDITINKRAIVRKKKCPPTNPPSQHRCFIALSVEAALRRHLGSRRCVVVQLFGNQHLKSDRKQTTSFPLESILTKDSGSGAGVQTWRMADKNRPGGFLTLGINCHRFHAGNATVNSSTPSIEKCRLLVFNFQL